MSPAPDAITDVDNNASTPFVGLVPTVNLVALGEMLASVTELSSQVSLSPRAKGSLMLLR